MSALPDGHTPKIERTTATVQLDDRVVIGGIAAHPETHEAAALDERGALPGRQQFPTTLTGDGPLLEWLRGFGWIDVVAIQWTGPGRLTEMSKGAGSFT